MFAAVFNKSKSLLAIIRLDPFDTSTADGRAKERVRKAGLTALTSATARIISMLTPLITLPLTLHYLGQERYGMWQTIASVMGMMVFADLGLGNGLLTAIAQAHGRNAEDEAGQLVSSAFYTLTLIATLMLIVFLALSAQVPWDWVFNVVSPLARNEARATMTACAICFSLNLPLGVVQNVQSGYQEGFQSNLWQCLGSIAALVTVVAAVYASVSLPVLVLGLMGTPILITLLNGLVYFNFQRPWLIPLWKRFDGRTARSLLRTGSSFLAISILMTIGVSADNIVIAQVLGAKAVTQLAVPARMAAPMAGVAMMVFLPMWSANGEAIARGDIAWVRRTTRRLTLLALFLTTTGALIYVLFGPWAIHLLVGNAVAPDRFLLAGLGTWSVMLAAVGPSFMVLNAARVLRPQIIMYLIFTAASIAFKLLLAKRFGITAMPWITVCAYGVCILIPLYLLLPRVLNGLQAERPGSPALSAA